MITNRRVKSLHARAHAYASQYQHKAPETWPKEALGIYWWGLYTGYQAGARSARKEKKR